MNRLATTPCTAESVIHGTPNSFLAARHLALRLQSRAVRLSLPSGLILAARCASRRLVAVFTAWKPTYGVVSAVGAMPLAPTLDTIGILARSASDLRVAARVLFKPSHVGSINKVIVVGDALKLAHPSIAKACRAGIDAIADCG